LLFIVYSLVIHSPIYYSTFQHLSVDYTIQLGVFLVYLSVTLLMSKIVHEKRVDVISMLDRLIELSVFLILASKFIHVVSGLYLLADDGYGEFRPHALFSEPSAMSPFFAYYIVKCLYFGRHFSALFAGLALLIITSWIALITFIILFFTSLMRRARMTGSIVVAAMMFLGCGLAYNYVINYEVTTGGMLDRQVIKLKRGLQIFDSSEKHAYNLRWDNSMDLISRVNSQFSAALFGLGPGSDQYIKFSERANSAPNLPLMFFISFGAVGLVAGVCFIVYGNFLQENFSYALILLALSLSSMYNSAQGLLVYQLILFFIMLGIYDKKVTVPGSA
jgi:hypothetical protein